jgi:4-amino-4-deoxychorismate lyase
MLINGERCSRIAATDRGLLYGDGLFETIAVVQKTPQFWSYHMERLQQGGARLSLALPDQTLLRQEAEQLIDEQWGESDERMVLKLIITRGSGGRGYRTPEVVSPSRILSCTPDPYSPLQRQQNSAQGVRLYRCETQLGSNPQLAGVKHLNRLEQVLARSEWSDPEIVEGALLNQSGALIEGTMSNLFAVEQGVVYTPELIDCGVEGVMRRVVIEQLQQHGVPVRVTTLPWQRIAKMDELFCTNSLIGVWPIREIGELQFIAPGPVTRHCIERLLE